MSRDTPSKSASLSAPDCAATRSHSSLEANAESLAVSSSRTLSSSDSADPAASAALACQLVQRQAAPRGTGRSRSFRRCIRSASIPFAQDAEPAGHPVAALTVISKLVAVMRKNSGEDTQCIMPGRQSGQSHQHDSGHPKHFAVHETIYVALQQIKAYARPLPSAPRSTLPDRDGLGTARCTTSPERASRRLMAPSSYVARDDQGPRPAPL